MSDKFKAIVIDNQKEKFLENAPESNDHYFLVPRVVE